MSENVSVYSISYWMAISAAIAPAFGIYGAIPLFLEGDFAQGFATLISFGVITLMFILLFFLARIIEKLITKKEESKNGTRN